MISSPSAQIVNAVAESHLITVGNPPERVPAYGPTMAVATAIIALGIALTTAVGPEKRGSHFESVVIGQQTEAEMAAEQKVMDVEKGDRDSVVQMEEMEPKK